jgi:hypothetical protein
MYEAIGSTLSTTGKTKTNHPPKKKDKKKERHILKL